MNFRITPRSFALRAALVILAASVVCVTALGSYTLSRGLTGRMLGSAQAGGPTLQPGQSTPLLDEQGNPLPAPVAGAQAPSIVQLAPWDGVGRVTVLLLGLDARDWEANTGPARSDTMILLTLDPLTKTAGILSIPRDMWVPIPGFKHGKINTAHYLGEAYKLPGGGPGLAVKTVEQFLGVPVNYYARIDFGAFVKFIDEIGGVKIDVPEKITIDLLGSGSKTKKTLKPGVQTLPGEWALAYARARHTQGGDFDRAKRQQQVILGIRDKVLSLNVLPTLVQKAPTLYSQLSAGIVTNLSLDEVIKLALLAQEVKKENIKQGVIGQGYTYFGFSPDNLSIVIPIPDKIHVLRDEIFATSGSLGPLTPGDDLQRMQIEGVTISVLNGSGTPELATRVAEYLRGKGANVVNVGDADNRYSSTTLIAHASAPYTMKYLSGLFSVKETRVYLKVEEPAPAVVELVLGDDAGGIPLP